MARPASKKREHPAAGYARDAIAELNLFIEFAEKGQPSVEYLESAEDKIELAKDELPAEDDDDEDHR